MNGWPSDGKVIQRWTTPGSQPVGLSISRQAQGVTNPQPSSNWGQPSGQSGGDWGQSSSKSSQSTGARGQSSRPTAAWGQSSQSTAEWGQSSQSTAAWGQSSQSTAAWGQSSQSSAAWGQSSQSTGAWGQSSSQSTGAKASHGGYRGSTSDWDEESPSTERRGGWDRALTAAGAVAAPATTGNSKTTWASGEDWDSHGTAATATTGGWISQADGWSPEKFEDESVAKGGQQIYDEWVANATQVQFRY